MPCELLNEALALAMRAPSNSNVQPWRLFVASGARRDRLVDAMLEAAFVDIPVTTGADSGLAETRTGCAEPRRTRNLPGY